jgi:1-deoxy-D-xylulose 5-phosphate reductoisomerase
MINAANEQAIILCKNNIINFSEILTVVKQTIKHFPIKKVTRIQEVYEIDKKVREYVKSKWNHQ